MTTDDLPTVLALKLTGWLTAGALMGAMSGCASGERSNGGGGEDRCADVTCPVGEQCNAGTGQCEPVGVDEVEAGYEVSAALGTMCQTLTDEEITSVLDYLTERFENGDSLMDAYRGVGGHCSESQSEKDDAIRCALCQGALILEVWAN